MGAYHGGVDPAVHEPVVVRDHHLASFHEWKRADVPEDGIGIVRDRAARVAHRDPPCAPPHL